MEKEQSLESRERMFDNLVILEYRRSPEYKAAFAKKKAEVEALDRHRLDSVAELEMYRTRRHLRGIMSGPAAEKAFNSIVSKPDVQKRLDLSKDSTANKIEQRKTSYKVLGVQTCPWRIFDDSLERMFAMAEPPFDKETLPRNVKLLLERMQDSSLRWEEVEERVALVPKDSREEVWRHLCLDFKDAIYALQLEQINIEFQGETMTRDEYMRAVLKNRVQV